MPMMYRERAQSATVNRSWILIASQMEMEFCQQTNVITFEAENFSGRTPA